MKTYKPVPFRKRPGIWVAEGGLIAAIIVGQVLGLTDLAEKALIAFAALAHKLVESEEKGEPKASLEDE